jgi:hypothetical protein
MGVTFDAFHSYDATLAGFVVALLIATLLISRLGGYIFPVEAATAAPCFSPTCAGNGIFAAGDRDAESVLETDIFSEETEKWLDAIARNGRKSGPSACVLDTAGSNLGPAD